MATRRGSWLVIEFLIGSLTHMPIAHVGVGSSCRVFVLVLVHFAWSTFHAWVFVGMIVVVIRPSHSCILNLILCLGLYDLACLGV